MGFSSARPIYENDTTRSAEREIVTVLADRWNCTAAKLPRAYILDFAMVRGGKVVAFLEVKDRPSYGWDHLDRMGGYFVSMHKWLKGREMLESAGIPFTLAVRASGDLRYLVQTHGSAWAHDGFRIGGRADRNDWQDREPVVHLLSNRFTRFAP